MNQRYIVSHTSIRGIAALLVVLYHLQFGAPFHLPFETATPFFERGYLWVDMFFVLSGFVICYSARSEDRAPYDWSQIKRFWVLRFARIYPLHIACLFAYLAVRAAETWLGSTLHMHVEDAGLWSAKSWMAFFEQLFLLNGWGLTGEVSWNIPSWSISAEVVAYLLFPILAALIARWKAPALALLALGAMAFYIWVGTTTGVLDIVKGTAILRCLAGFSLGMILYAFRREIDRLGNGILGAIQFIGLMLVLTTLLAGLNDVYAVPGFILIVAATWPDRGWLSRPLKSRPLHWLGEISYSVYLNHFWVLSIWSFGVERVMERLGMSPTAMRITTLVCGLALVLFVSHLSFRLIEGPARKAIANWYKQRKAVAPSSALHVENRLT